MNDSILLGFPGDVWTQISSYFFENEIIRLYLIGNGLLTKKMMRVNKKLELKWKSYKFVDTKTVFGFAALFRSLEFLSFHDVGAHLVELPVAWHLLPPTLKHLDISFIGCWSSLISVAPLKSLWPMLETLQVAELQLAQRILGLPMQSISLDDLGLPDTLRSLKSGSNNVKSVYSPASSLMSLPLSMEHLHWNCVQGHLDLSRFNLLRTLDLSITSTARFDPEHLPPSIVNLTLSGSGASVDQVVWKALFPDLISLDIQHTSYRCSSFSTIQEMPISLTSLHMRATDFSLTPGDTAWLRTHAHRFVQFPWNPSILEELEHFTSLRSIVVDSERGIFETSPITLPPNITSVSTHRCHITNFPPGLTSLDTVTLPFSELPSDASLQLRCFQTLKVEDSLLLFEIEALPASLTHLEAHLGEQEIFDALAQALPALRTLVCRSDLFGDNPFFSHSSQLPPLLESLEAHDGKFSDEFLEDLPLNSTLRSLDSPSGNGRQLLAHLPSGLTALSMHLADCGLLGSEIVSRLPRSLTSIFFWTTTGFIFPFDSNAGLLPPRLTFLSISPNCSDIPTKAIVNMPPYLCIKHQEYYLSTDRKLSRPSATAVVKNISKTSQSPSSS